ncbi:chitin synthase chs-2-like [Octopus sinensis]|uniref:chitin synthase n=1 Tax=Octopus sinensis TaxID=2607531 RepID=A0A7E6FK49_9MOLL|nr:chitin synthase chs-2-like [Octopus sinensis]
MPGSRDSFVNHAYINDFQSEIRHVSGKKLIGFSDDVLDDAMTSGNALGKSSRRYRDSYLHNFSGNLILDKLLAAKRNIFQQNENCEIRRPWDVFRHHNQRYVLDDDKTFIIRVIKVIKILMSIVMLLAVITLTLISKSCLFLITSNIYKDLQMKCTLKNGNLKCWRTSATPNDQLRLQPSLKTRIKWIWALIIIVCAPYLLTTLRCLWRICFKNNKKFTWSVFFIVFFVESLQSVGMAIFVIYVLPNIDPLRGESLMFGGAFIPAILKLIDKKSDFGKPIYKTVLDILSVITQATIFLVWPILEWNAGRKSLAIYMPVSLFLISLNWWENYIGKVTWLGERATQKLLKLKRHVRTMHSYIYFVIGIWKCALTIGLVSLMVSETDMGCLKLLYFQKTDAVPCQMISYQTTNVTSITYKNDDGSNGPFWVALIQVASCLVCYIIARNACKVMLQVTSFSVPLVLSSPLTIAFFLGNCELWHKNNDFTWFDPKVMFWTCDVPNNSFSYTLHLINDYYLPIVLAWWLSFLWITSHIWYPNVERLVRTERLFVKTFFCDVFLQLSLTLNRRNDEHDKNRIRSDKVHAALPSPTNNSLLSIAPPAHSLHHTVPMIYVCATMWHETEKEMKAILTSLFRLDLDQSVRSYAQLFDVVDPNYYEFEAHIFFDDAFEYSELENDFKVNSYVNGLIKQMNAAVNNVHKISLVLSPPVLYNTPYGGRMEWVMPGNNKLVVHLKNKDWIRPRKRWSQVMYMYYFLGYNLLGTSHTARRKQTIADNTFLLALDGDVDFKPEALQLLVDRMKKNEKVGAACGRILPRGSGPVLWYQRFEYSISHWLQKATEHVIGCVLCSPGCFSLFRASALMDDNVMRKYASPASEARDFVQYDQGEDRWLCTLLLQRGYRVEYCAASDAFTFAPEGFNEFFNQRRRWIPSTMANIFDVLQNWREVIKINEDISTLYILYQSSLFLLTLLTPGTIFLLIVGAIAIAFPSISLIESLVINIIPLIIFVLACFFLSTNAQLVTAAILTCIYTLSMILVVIGLILKMAEEGICAPTTLFFLFLLGIFISAGLLHPLEIWNIIHGPIYLLTSPCSGMLMIIYAICNMNKISWGTRESRYQASQQKAQEEKAKLSRNKKWWSFLKRKSDKPFSLAELLTCKCCLKASDITEDMKMNTILDKLDMIEKRIENLPKSGNYSLEGSNISSTFNSSAPNDSGKRRTSHTRRSKTDRREGSGAYERSSFIRSRISGWQRDLQDLSAETSVLSENEREFWDELIKKYLEPINVSEETQMRDEKNLDALRNKVCLFFFLCNGLFTIIIFTLQFINNRSTNTDSAGLYISLPCYSNTGYELKVEPLSMLFMVMFGVILLIQFSAMVYHRLSTLLHILASTHINCLKPSQSEMSYMNIFSNLELVRDMINQEKEDDEKSILSNDSITTSAYNTPPKKRRKTVMKLARKNKTKQPSHSLADLFLRSFVKLAHDIDQESTEDGLEQEKGAPKIEPSLKFQGKNSMHAFTVLKDQKHSVLDKINRINDIIRQKELSKLAQIPEHDSNVSFPSTSQTPAHTDDASNTPAIRTMSSAKTKRKTSFLARVDELETFHGSCENHSHRIAVHEISDSDRFTASYLDVRSHENVSSNYQIQTSRL